MSNGEVKRIQVYHLRETFCPRALLVDDKSPMPDHESFLIQAEDHERVVAGLKEELEVFRNREYGFENELELKQTIASQKRVIEKLRTYVQHRVDCICRAGVLQYSDSCDCGLDAIEKG